MKRSTFLASLILLFITSSAQKPPLDTSVLGKWPSMGGIQITGDGQYVSYYIVDKFKNETSLIVKSLFSSWETTIHGNTYSLFTGDNRIFVYTDSSQRLGILTLGTLNNEYIPDVLGFKLSDAGRGNWLACQQSEPSRRLLLRNIETGKSLFIDSVDNYIFSNKGGRLLIEKSQCKNGSLVVSISIINLSDGSQKEIWLSDPGTETSSINNITLNESGTQLAFVETGNKESNRNTGLWIYQLRSGTAKRISLQFPIDQGDSLCLEKIIFFSRNDSLLFVSLTTTRPHLPSNPGIVDIWSSTDAQLFSEQEQTSPALSFIASIDLLKQSLTRLSYRNETAFLSSDIRAGDKYLLIKHKQGPGGKEEENWNPAAKTSLLLESSHTGLRKELEQLKDGIGMASISPDNSYVVFFDPNLQAYFSYNIQTGDKVNLTKHPSPSWSIYGGDRPVAKYSSYNIGGWLSDGSGVLLYDQWDIWLFDLEGKKSPVNLTNGYGRAHRIKFDLPQQNTNNIFDPHATIILSAFNRNTKESGFFRLSLSKLRNLTLLSMGPYFFDIVATGENYLKAAKNNTYIVHREKSSEYPNYFFTRDFKDFTPITDLHPESGYNWYRTELFTWKTYDGITAQGILYKPDNFDSKKKYPLIINYYEKKSDNLNKYKYPNFISDEINIPWFVSNGYLVAAVDIYYSFGEPGKSAFNSVVPAALYLSTLPFVDRKRMGIQGHSFGGYETDYLITHTHLFAAAMSASGTSNLISHYGGLWGDGSSKKGSFEMEQFRMCKTLWDIPQKYIANSPVFRANHVTTPLLMMNNKEDGAVPFANGVEFFTDLRRLGKKVWMLQYHGEGHSLGGKAAMVDYTLRMTQFFDHYLKGNAAAMWLNKGPL